MRISTYEAYYISIAFIFFFTFLQATSLHLHLHFPFIIFVRNDHYFPKIWGYNSSNHMGKYK